MKSIPVLFIVSAVLFSQALQAAPLKIDTQKKLETYYQMLVERSKKLAGEANATNRQERISLHQRIHLFEILAQNKEWNAASCVRLKREIVFLASPGSAEAESHAFGEAAEEKEALDTLEALCSKK